MALYGDSNLQNAYLGRGTFQSYIPMGSAQGRQILSASPLYTTHGAPANARAFIGLTGVSVAARGESLASLGGTIRASNLPLTLANIPNGASRAQVYYY